MGTPEEVRAAIGRVFTDELERPRGEMAKRALTVVLGTEPMISDDDR
jgi:hypothetical protein